MAGGAGLLGMFGKINSATMAVQSQVLPNATPSKVTSLFSRLRIGGGAGFGINLSQPEREELQHLFSGHRTELAPTTHQERVTRLQGAKRSMYPGLAWCSRCTRVYAGETDKGGLAGALTGAINGTDHRCSEFLFPGFEGLCIECACARGAKIPCAVTGELFAPRSDDEVEGFGHTIVSPQVEEMLKQKAIIEADRSIRMISELELEAEAAVKAAKRLFKECPVDIKPRSYFVTLRNPHWLIGQYVRVQASVVGIEVAQGGYDADGTYYARADGEAFQLRVLDGRLEVDMAVDPDQFSPERANAIGSAATGAFTGGMHRASWGVQGWGGGKAVAAGAALGAVQGLMAAAEQQRQADAARAELIKFYVNGVFGNLETIVKTRLFESEPQMLARAARVPKRTRITAWPDGINVGRAAAQLAKHPIG